MSAENVLIAVTVGMPVLEEDIEYAFEEMCENLHANCCVYCPIYRISEGTVIQNGDCKVFKNGAAMVSFLRNAIVEDVIEVLGRR